MLILKRRKEEEIIVCQGQVVIARIMVVDTGRDFCRLGTKADGLEVHRREVYEKCYGALPPISRPSREPR